jgi:hypothetical protein
MTSIGFHYFPDEDHYRSTDLRAWLPELQALGARWLTLVGSVTRAVPEPFVRGLVQAGVEPIVHITASPIRPVNIAHLKPLLESYEHWGVKHVVLFNEPNSRAMWPAPEWGKTALVERFLDILAPVLLAQAEAGLQPTFPPLKAGGEWWDTAFLEAALASLTRRGLQTLMKQMTFAVNLWTFNRPVDWGAGGLKQWPETRPFRTPLGSQDQRGFHLFDWYNEIIAARAGEARPIICLAGGPRLGDLTDPNFPAVDEARHASCTKDIAEAVNAGTLPGNVLNVNFWLIGASEGTPFAPETLYRTDGRTLPAVEALKRLATMKGRGGGKNSGKTIRHYLLLPTFEWGISEWHWQAALKYVQAHRPTCGFSADEARQAQFVTIFGNEQGVSKEIENTLKQAGCRVERMQVNGKQ